jgi:caffeoyl-CoA O-methyltransferase
VVLPRPVTPVSILAAKLESLNRRLETSDRIDSSFRSELRLACELAGGLDAYVSSCTTPPSPALQAIAERTQAEDWGRGAGGGAGPSLEQEMLSGHVEGQALNFLVHLTGATRVLEIGMFTGYSALAMAEALPDNGQVVACEVDAHVADIAQRCFDRSPGGQKITVVVGPALETLRRLAADDATFDFVFVDADKANYAAYLEILLDTGLLTPRGLICVDNTLMQGLPYTSPQATANATAIATFNQVVVDDPRVVQVLVPLRDGLTLIRRA